MISQRLGAQYIVQLSLASVSPKRTTQNYFSVTAITLEVPVPKRKVEL